VAEIVQALVRAYDGLFGFALPYVMSMHQAPTDGGDWDDVSHLHLEFTPLHRAADKLKYLAGSELGAGSFVSDVAPEAAAAALREVVA
jgi:UDPglucose--hexose-1-phosphate uridylyltransferase